MSTLSTCSHHPKLTPPDNRIAWTLATSGDLKRGTIRPQILSHPEHVPLSELIEEGCIMILRPDQADASDTGFDGFVPENPRSVRGTDRRSRLVYSKPRRPTSRENFESSTDTAHEQPFLSLDSVIEEATRQAKLPTTNLDL